MAPALFLARWLAEANAGDGHIKPCAAYSLLFAQCPCLANKGFLGAICAAAGMRLRLPQL
jgi:hypothetical protein